MKLRFSREESLCNEPLMNDKMTDSNFVRMSAPSKSSDDESVGTNKKSFAYRIRK